MPHGGQPGGRAEAAWPWSGMWDVGNGHSAGSRLDERYFRYFINGNGNATATAVGAAVGAGAAWIYDALRQLPL